QRLIIIGLKPNGERDWDCAEYALVKNVDPARKTITVERGCFSSIAKSYDGNKAYVAPITVGVWGNKPMWFYNLSSLCPMDKNGKVASDILTEEMTEWFSPGGKLEDFNGIAFDVVYWNLKRKNMDVNNDGIEDTGVFDGVNTWRQGGARFLAQVRQAVGENRLITADGQHSGNQQALGILDGIESEGLVQHDDGFRGFSRTLNTHLYWMENNTRPLDFRYVSLKLITPADDKRGNQLRRFAIGTACCLGASVTRWQEGDLPEGFAFQGSLGFPSGPLIRPAQNTPDLLMSEGNPLKQTILGRLQSTNCKLTWSDNGLEVSPESSASMETPMTVTVKGVTVPANGDLTVYVEMQALEPLEGFDMKSPVPRAVCVEFSQFPKIESRKLDEYYRTLNGYMGTQKKSLISFYLRRPNTKEQSIDVSFQIEGRGRARISSITAHQAPDSLVRAFEKGVVVVNPSLEAVKIPLVGLPPGIASPSDVDVPGLTAMFLPRSAPAAVGE
ncbi:MAG: hypothetical protein RL693_2790, partial [Verrucomicrobiota bacterium]